MNNILFTGCATALVTPFREGRVDFDAFEKIIEHQIAGGVAALVVLGTTGEPCTLTTAERTQLVKFAKRQIRKRVKLIVGTGSNNTREAIKNSLAAKKLGADGLLVVTPYYNKCTQRGLVKYYNAIADAVQIPVIAYNVPGRTGVNIAPATAAALAENPHIVGLKEAGGNLAQILALAHATRGKMALYSGEDEANLLYAALGAHGFISVAANAIPEKIVSLFNLCKDNDIQSARELHDHVYEFCGALFCEVNPIPIKAVMHHLGFCTDEMRAPLTTIEKDNRERLVEAWGRMVKLPG